MTLTARLNPNYWLKQLYNWVMEWAVHPAATKMLCFLAVIEAIFFPIPVDPMIMAMGAARPHKALWYGLLAGIFSTLGGVIGYFLGALLWDQMADFFFAYVISVEKFNLVMSKFNEHAFWAMFLAGFTPIPFKVFTIAAGVANIAFTPFLLGSLLSRCLRFCIEGGLMYLFGPRTRIFIEKYFEKITLAVGVLIIMALVIYQLRQ